MRFLGSTSIALCLLAAPALADGPPPDDAMKLSQIIAAVEQRENFHYVENVEWDDDDDGYYEVEYVTRDGREHEIKLDARSGEQR